MIDVAQEKARTAGVEIDFLKGDICSYQLDMVFDAALGLYALTSLVDDKDFCAAFASTRQALRTGGIFYFNAINSEARGPFPPEVDPPPMLFLGTAAKEADVKLVQFNNLVVQGDLWTRTAVYLIEDAGQTRLEIHDDHLQLRRLDDVKALLADHGFRFESVTYVDAMGYNRWDMHICAIAVDN
jgi:SAM-dependent methyltransferase